MGNEQQKASKKIPKCNELMWILGILFVALGVCLCSKSDLGVSMIAAPAFIVYEAVQSYWSGFSVGMIDYLIQGIILCIVCIVIRKFNWRFLLAFLTSVIYGYVLDMWILIFKNVIIDPIYLKWIILIIGDCSIAFGVACFFRTYLPLEVAELAVKEISFSYKLQITKFKWVYDAICLVVSFILAISIFRDITKFDWSTIYYTSYHHIGLATFITAAINAPLIKLSGIVIDKVFDTSPLIPKLANFLDTQGTTY